MVENAKTAALSNFLTIWTSYGFKNSIYFSGEDSCNGDSGGPLVYRPRPDSPWYQVGIVSFGTRQCGTGQPGVYTRLSPFISWIQSHLEAWNKKCNFWTQDKNNLTYKSFVLFLFRWTSFPVILRSQLNKVWLFW